MTKKKFNIIDILILVVVLILAILAAYKFGVVNQKESQGISEESKTAICTAVIDDVRMMTVEALHVGDEVFDKQTDSTIGVITDVQYAPKMKNVVDGEGNEKLVEYPQYYTVTLTIESDIVEKTDGYFANGVIELKTNSYTEIYTKYAQTSMKLTAINL